MNTKPVVAAVAIAIGALALAACDRQEMNARTDRAVAKTEQVAAKIEKTADELAITASVKASLVKDPELSALRIDVDTNGSTVTLTGTAPNTRAAERAQNIAIATNGVTAVSNNLTTTGG
jgi:hyperosmotically inducible periplasmic protein